MTQQKNELKYIHVSKIKPNEWNPQHQNEETFSRLVDEILDNGFIDPLEVIPLENDTYMILGGEHRWRAAKSAGEEEVPCIVLMDEKFKDKDIQKFVTVRLNTIKGNLDPTKFLNLYNELSGKYGKDAMHKLMGFTNAKYMKSLLKSVKDNLKQNLPKELHPKMDELAKEAKTVEDLGNVVQTLYHQNVNTIDIGYMVMSFNGQEHIYIKMDKDFKKTMDKMLSYCKTTKTDISSAMGTFVKEHLEDLIAALASPSTEASKAEEVPF